MPNGRSLRWLARSTVVVTSLGVTSGLLAIGHGAVAGPIAVAQRSHVTTSTSVAPPVTEPPTTAPPTTAAPRPVVTAPPVTAAPRPVTTAAPRHVAHAAALPSGTPEERGQQALALINYPWQALGYTISFEPGRQTYLGLTDQGTRIIHIYVRDSESLDTLARTIGHEMGHALDFGLTTDAERQQYIAIRGINSTLDTWYSCDACTDYSTAAGDWAETFQYWLLGPGQFWSQMGPAPTADQLAQLSAIFAPQL